MPGFVCIFHLLLQYAWHYAINLAWEGIIKAGGDLLQKEQNLLYTPFIMYQPSNTDWDTVTKIGSRANAAQNRASVARTQGQINAARRAGAVLETDKKFSAGGNAAHKSTDGQHLTKIDRENEVKPPSTVSRDVGVAISKGRQEKGLTQKDLATRINEKPTVVNDYESGRAVPNQQILGKMERVLGVKLRGANIGAPLGGPKKK